MSLMCLMGQKQMSQRRLNKWFSLKDAMIYSDGRGNQMTSSGYEGFNYFSSNSFNLETGDLRDIAFMDFCKKR